MTPLPCAPMIGSSGAGVTSSRSGGGATSPAGVAAAGSGGAAGAPNVTKPVPSAAGRPRPAAAVGGRGRALRRRGRRRGLRVRTRLGRRRVGAASLGAGAPNVTNPDSATGSSGGGVGGPVGTSIGPGSSGPAGASVGGGVAGPGGAAVPPGGVSETGWPQAKLWNSSDGASPALVPSNGAGVSGLGVSTCSARAESRAERRQRGPSSPMMSSSNSSHASLADCVRSFGSLTSSCSIQSEIPWSIVGSIDFTGGISSLTWRSRIAIGASESWNGTLPVNISNAMQPTE